MSTTRRDDRDAERFRRLFETYHRDVHAYALRRVVDGVDAGDIAAEVFATVWRTFDRVPGAAVERAWLFGVARRVLANAHRGARRRTRLSARLLSLANPVSVPGPAEALDEVAACRAALDRLHPAQREVLLLVVWDGLRPEEAAVALGCSVNAVRLRLSRARRRLRRLLEEDLSAVVSDPMARPIPSHDR